MVLSSCWRGMELRSADLHSPPKSADLGSAGGLAPCGEGAGTRGAVLGSGDEVAAQLKMGVDRAVGGKKLEIPVARRLMGEDQATQEQDLGEIAQAQLESKPPQHD